MSQLVPVFNARTKLDGPLYADYIRLAQGSDALAAGIAGKLIVGSVKKYHSIYEFMDVVILAAKLHNQYAAPYNPTAGKPIYYCFSSDSFMPDPNPELKPGEQPVTYVGNKNGYACRQYDEDGNLIASCPLAQWTTETDPLGNTKRVPPKCETVLTLLFVDIKTGVCGQMPVPKRSFSAGENLITGLGEIPYSRVVRIQPIPDPKNKQFWKVNFILMDAIDEENYEWYQNKLADYAPTFLPKPREQQQQPPQQLTGNAVPQPAQSSVPAAISTGAVAGVPLKKRPF